MSAPESVGTLRVELLCRVGDAEPTSLGWIPVLIVLSSPSTRRLEVDLSGPFEYVSELFKQVFADPSLAADHDGTDGQPVGS